MDQVDHLLLLLLSFLPFLAFQVTPEDLCFLEVL